MSSMPSEPTKVEIVILRNSANDKFNELGIHLFDERDVSRIMHDDDYIRRFLMHHDNNQKLALDMIIDTLKWRKELAVNDIRADNVSEKFFELAALFVHNRDMDGCSMLIFIVSKHVKGVNDMDELKRFLIYWLERLEREEYGKWITVFFDMRDTGMKNMDMEFIQYMINLFKSYYPWILNYIIVFEMPWLLNAMWKIIKTWLPPKSVEKIKFVNQSSLPQYVATDQALQGWGGSDAYSFKFVPEKPRPLPWMQQTPESEVKKQVHFSDSTDGIPPQVAAVSVTASVVAGASSGALLQMSPSEELLFECSEYYASASITLTNPGQGAVCYKVKTTSPNKFRVRPSVGVLSGGASAVVHVTAGVGADSGGSAVNPGQMVREKFLVIAMPATGEVMAGQDIAAAFKAAPKNVLSEVRLRVGVASSVGTSNGGLPQQEGGHAVLMSKLDELLRGQRGLQNQLNDSRWLVLTALVVLVAVLVVLVVLVVNTTNTTTSLHHQLAAKIGGYPQDSGSSQTGDTRGEL